MVTHKGVKSLSTPFSSFPPQRIWDRGRVDSACGMIEKKDKTGRVPPIAASSSDSSSNSLVAPGCWGETGVNNGVLGIVAEGSLRCEVRLEA